MLATYRSCGFAGPTLGLYVGNLQVLFGLLDLHVGNLQVLSGVAGPPLGLYVGNLQVLWGLLDRLGAVCWQPTGLIGVAGPPLGLYVGNLQVLSGLLDRLWACMLATYRSYGGCWTAFGAVCWQPTGYMIGAKWVAQQSSGIRELYVGNLQVLSGMLDRQVGYRSQQSCRHQPLELYVGNLQVLCMIGAKSFGGHVGKVSRHQGAVCLETLQAVHDWSKVQGTCKASPHQGAVCRQPTSLHGGCWTALGLVCWHSYKSCRACRTAFGPVCRQPTSYMIGAKWVAQQSSGIRELYVGNLQVLS